jgi:hypothetical protein
MRGERGFFGATASFGLAIPASKAHDYSIIEQLCPQGPSVTERPVALPPQQRECTNDPVSQRKPRILRPRDH